MERVTHLVQVADGIDEEGSFKGEDGDKG